jgi:hypothetical protein
MKIQLSIGEAEEYHFYIALHVAALQRRRLMQALIILELLLELQPFPITRCYHHAKVVSRRDQ